MKRAFLLFATIVLLASCSGLKHAEKATKHDFDQYKGKTVSSIQYIKDGADKGNVLQINFKDGTTLKVYSEKYGMKILK